MNRSVRIRPVGAGDAAAWRKMWEAYCAFYETVVSEEVTAGLWARLLEPSGATGGLLALNAEAGNALGFAHYVIHPHTWSAKNLCYLEDLFVEEEARERGVGRALIERLLTLGRENDWKRVYWHTNAENETARRLYDRFTPADNYVRYTIEIDTTK